MKIQDVVKILGAEVLCGADKLDMELEYAFASDLMSDVLTTQAEEMLLLTGLANVQAIRTAEMSDINCLVIVRNKTVSSDMIEVAKDGDIVLLKCSFSMFKAAGLLYQHGMKAIF